MLFYFIGIDRRCNSETKSEHCKNKKDKPEEQKISFGELATQSNIDFLANYYNIYRNKYTRQRNILAYIIFHFIQNIEPTQFELFQG